MREPALGPRRHCSVPDAALKWLVLSPADPLLTPPGNASNLPSVIVDGEWEVEYPDDA